MRIPASVLAVLAATLFASPVLSEEPAEKVKALQRDRIAVLKDLTEVLEKLYTNARVEINEPLQARQLLLEAELEAAKTEAERLEIYKKFAVAMKQHEETADARRMAGRATTAEGLKAKAMRLEAEIRLEKEKAKAANGAGK